MTNIKRGLVTMGSILAVAGALVVANPQVAAACTFYYVPITIWVPVGAVLIPVPTAIWGCN